MATSMATSQIDNEEFTKTILDKVVKLSEDVGVGILSYCAKLY